VPPTQSADGTALEGIAVLSISLFFVTRLSSGRGFIQSPSELVEAKAGGGFGFGWMVPAGGRHVLICADAGLLLQLAQVFVFGQPAGSAVQWIQPVISWRM
jgi:hypothetical protein